ncbi:MAG TPA: zincin-like metallopeptidase domain-containing protein [Candidatus Acidoferrales bacterium]|jgi:antirestriction protein ArdC|nr:zincin-like metallopeptidase domain-containing protein [Candidatus Acidoferrales bacterium]
MNQINAAPLSDSTSRKNVYEIVTDQIIRQLEQGVAPWRKPWRTEAPCNLVSGKPYRGINVFLLASQGYESRYWLSYNQAAKLGGHVKKGEHSSIVTFWNIGEEKIKRDAEGTERKSRPFLLKFYRIFNICQTEGIAENLGLGNSIHRVASIEQCEAIVKGMPNAPRTEQSDRAWYRPSTDTVGMPARGLFNSPEEYYSTFFHELTHSTGHASRVGREGIEQLNPFGSESYSKEELVAEMGAAMLCGITGIEQKTLGNSAAYLKSWINVLKSDSRMVVSAASQAQKAADYIQGGAA